MGCDIHLTVEWQRPDDTWVMINYVTQAPARDRNYRRFAALAGVRGPGPEPRGVPDDCSAGTNFWIEHYGDDGHSHSWAFLAEFLQVCRETEYQSHDARGTPRYRYWDEGHYFGLYLDNETFPRMRVVYWFDS